MAANSSLNLVSLDFDGIKDSLKSYLSAQPQLKDYDFEGSTLNVLLDVLAYNTQKNIFFLNMNFAEGFLDTAQLLHSVISHAKDLNYTPRSARSASANVTVTFTASGESQPYTIPKGSSFSSVIKNQAFIFSIPEAITVASEDENFTFTTTIYEGIYLKDSYIFKNQADVQRFKISNKNVDTTSITVSVYEDGSVTGESYLPKTSLLDLDENSKVYFLQATENGYYEIIFGDNNIGRQPKENALIVIDYRISQGIKANGAKIFGLNFDPTGEVTSELLTIPVCETNTSAASGADPESIESIRYTAPRHFQTQERTIVPSDYEIALQTEFPEINAVSVFGGEDHDPPLFGRVIIAVDVENVEGLPDSKKDLYYKFIRRRSPLKPIFVEPLFTYLDVKTVVRYNQNITTSSPTTIKTLVLNTINTYNNENLNDFGVEFRYSPFTTAIDDTDESIISNVTDIQIYKKLVPNLDELLDLELDFGVPLHSGFGNKPDRHPHEDLDVISSTPFKYNGTLVELEDDGDGNVRLVRQEGEYHIKVTNIGTVNYETGKVSLSNLIIESFQGSAILVYALPKDKDIVFPKDTISLIEPAAVSITVEGLKE